MATYALIHGAGDSAFYWHLLEPELRARGQEAIAMDLPCEDDRAGFPDYADAVVAAVAGREGPDLILVAQSLGGFTAPLVCARVAVGLLVLVAGMVPAPGECGDDWPANTGYPGPDGEGETEIFYEDVPELVAAEAMKRGRHQADAPGAEPWPLEAWPEVPTRYLLCGRDRMFPPDWLRGVVRARLGIEPDEIDSGHCPALSQPRQLAERLEAYRRELDLS
ncbi:MAG: alpha/beta hydrolase [Actinobacteria bacterium]|nr:alpha/beta hydrolase [Actinomycetota bacterium]